MWRPNDLIRVMPAKGNMKRALICLDGEPPSKKIIYSLIRNDVCVVAADGGANWLFDYGIAPDILIGDLDGVRKNILSKLPSTDVIQKKDQYSTDLEKAFAWVIQNRYDHVTVLAMAGKRIDHLLSNFALIWSFHRKISIDIVHDGWHACLLPNQPAHFETKKGMTVSLVPYSDCLGITLQGFKYPLKNARMKLGEVGVSNIAIGKKVKISIRKGRALAVFLEKKS